MLQSQVQSLSSLPQTDFLTEIFSSPEEPVPKAIQKKIPFFVCSSGRQFLRAPLFCPNFFHQSRGFGVANKPDGLWLTYSGKEFMGQIGKASESTGRPERQIQETSIGRRDTAKVLLQRTCQQTWVTPLALDMHPAGTAKASGAS